MSPIIREYESLREAARDSLVDCGGMRSGMWSEMRSGVAGKIRREMRNERDPHTVCR